MLNCEIIRDLLPHYAAGTLSPSSKAAVEEHALTCPVCAELLERQDPQAKKAALQSRRKKHARRAAPVIAFAVVLGLLALLLSRLMPAPRQVIESTCPDAPYTAQIELQDDSFEFSVLVDNQMLLTKSLGGEYRSMLWSADGSYLAISFTLSGQHDILLIGTADSTITFLCVELQEVLPQHFSWIWSGQVLPAFSVQPCLWDYNGEKLLLYGHYQPYADTPADPGSPPFTGQEIRRGYFWYDPVTKTISNISGFQKETLTTPPPATTNPNAR